LHPFDRWNSDTAGRGSIARGLAGKLPGNGASPLVSAKICHWSQSVGAFWVDNGGRPVDAAVGDRPQGDVGDFDERLAGANSLWFVAAALPDSEVAALYLDDGRAGVDVLAS
jgi:hypothetical protein